MPVWSKMRKKLEDNYLCPKLRGRIRYFAASYSRCPDHEGRAAILLDGREVLKGNYYEARLIEGKVLKEAELSLDSLPYAEKRRIVDQITLERGGFDQRDFYQAFDEFDNESIEQSLQSENPLVRVFALLDRRVGKRSLIALRAQMEQEVEWVRFFYLLRLDAEGLPRTTEV